MDYDFNLETGNRIIISEEFNGFIFTEDPNYVGYVAGSYDQLIQDSFGGHEDNLWNFLTTLPPDNEFRIYCDPTAFDIMLVKYFKATFPLIESQDLYVLYRLTLMKFKLMHSQVAHEWDTAKRQFQSLDIKDRKTFDLFVTTINPIDNFTLSVKQNISLEYLIAAYLASDNSVLESEFIERAEKIIWKSVAWEINEFKRNILNGFYDLGSLYPELEGKMDFTSSTIDDVVSTVPLLSFLCDIDCHPDNVEYIKNTYDVPAIFEIYYKLIKHTHGDAEAIDGFLRAHAHYTGTAASVFDTNDKLVVVDNDIDALLNLDINSKFGTSLFARSEYRNKMNPHIISYFYSLKRADDMETLNRFVAA
jgi:hypothetical protein